MNGGRASRRGLAAPSHSSTDPARTTLNGTASARIPATHPITTISDIDAMTLELMEHVVEMCILEECFDEHRTLSVLSRFHAYPTQEPIDLAVHGAVNSNGLPSSASAPSLVSAGGTSSTTSAGAGKAGRAPECVCQTCKRSIAASRFAPHLEKCLGMGRNSCRVARRKMQAYSETPTKEATPSSRGDGSDEEDEATPHDAETDDDDWSSKKKKKGKSKAKRRKTEREHSA